MIEDPRVMTGCSTHPQTPAFSIPNPNLRGSVRDIPKKNLWGHMPALLHYVLIRVLEASSLQDFVITLSHAMMSKLVSGQWQTYIYSHESQTVIA